MTQLAADQQITLQAFQAAVDIYNQRGLDLPGSIATIANSLESHIDQLDTLSESDPTFQMLYDAARSALQSQSGQRAKFLPTSSISLTALTTSTNTIESTPGTCGGHPRLKGTRIPVWTLVSLKQQGAEEPELLRNFPSLTPESLNHVWIYYDRHRREIDQAIASHQAD